MFLVLSLVAVGCQSLFNFGGSASATLHPTAAHNRRLQQVPGVLTPTVTEISTKKIILKNVPFDLDISLKWIVSGGGGAVGSVVYYSLSDGDNSLESGNVSVTSDGELIDSLSISEIELEGYGDHTLHICVGMLPNPSTLGSCVEHSAYVIEGFLSLIPTIIALIIALISHQVLLALFMGVFCASFFIYRYNPFTGFLRTLDTYFLEAVTDEGHAYLILYTLFVAGLIGVVTKGGGIKALAVRFGAYVSDRYKAQLCAYFFSWMIFFDDYSNCLMTGNTMAPLMQRMHVSYEKLAYIVDCVAAPLASIAPLSSWVGIELSLIEEGYKAIGREDVDVYFIFLESIPSRFYPIITLIFVFFVIVSRRDFGPMLQAERKALANEAKDGKYQFEIASNWDRDAEHPPEGLPLSSVAGPPAAASSSSASAAARSRLPRPPSGPLDALDAAPQAESEHKDESLAINSSEVPAMPEHPLDPFPGRPQRIMNAALPILLTIALVLTGVVLTGYYNLPKGVSSSAKNLFSYSDSFQALLYASFVGLLFAIALLAVQKVMNLTECVAAMIAGMHATMEVLVVLIFSWAIGSSIADLQAGQYLASTMDVDSRLLPFLVFVIGGLISFCTGTSYGTMGILFPLVIPLANSVGKGDDDVLLSAVASILSGAIFGDHCSPLSDTTILSSASSRCKLMAHVKTQLPYALLVAVVSMLLGSLATGYKVYPNYVGVLLSVLVLVVILFIVGRKVDSPEPDCWRQVQRCYFTLTGKRYRLDEDEDDGPLTHGQHHSTFGATDS